MADAVSVTVGSHFHGYLHNHKDKQILSLFLIIKVGTLEKNSVSNTKPVEMRATKKAHSFHLYVSQMISSRKNSFSQMQVPSS